MIQETPTLLLGGMSSSESWREATIVVTSGTLERATVIILSLTIQYCILVLLTGLYLQCWQEFS